MAYLIVHLVGSMQYIYWSCSAQYVSMRFQTKPQSLVAMWSHGWCVWFVCLVTKHLSLNQPKSTAKPTCSLYNAGMNVFLKKFVTQQLFKHLFHHSKMPYFFVHIKNEGNPALMFLNLLSVWTMSSSGHHYLEVSVFYLHWSAFLFTVLQCWLTDNLLKCEQLNQYAARGYNIITSSHC